MNKSFIAAAAAAALLCGCSPKQAPTLTRSGLDPADFVSEYNGSATGLYTMTNDSGMEVCVTNFGGRIVSIMVPARDGSFKDVVLGFDHVSDYFPENNKTDFGAAIGRYANRIKEGHFTLDGRDISLDVNNNGNCLHGGPTGWQYQVYDVLEADSKHVKIERVSPDGDNGFPGEVHAYVTYTLNEDNSISISYEAVTDAATVVNLTNHSYFNLSGDPTKPVTDHVMTVRASGYTPTDSLLMPTGEIAPVDGTPMDFRTARLVGQDIDSDFDALKMGDGYDHNWCLDTEGDMNVAAVSVTCPETGIRLDVYTDEPGVQIYAGNQLDGTVKGKGGTVYGKRAGLVLETQHFPDSPNFPQWPSTVLRPGEKYTSHCTFAFSIAE